MHDHDDYEMPAGLTEGLDFERTPASYNAMADQHDGHAAPGPCCAMDGLAAPLPARGRYEIAQEVHNGQQHLVIKGTSDHVPLDEIAVAYNGMVDQLDATPVTIKCNGTPVATAATLLLAMDLARTMSWKRTGTLWSVHLAGAPAPGASYRAGQQVDRPEMTSNADLGAADIVITADGTLIKSRWRELIGAHIVVVPSEP